MCATSVAGNFYRAKVQRNSAQTCSTSCLCAHQTCIGLAAGQMLAQMKDA